MSLRTSRRSQIPTQASTHRRPKPMAGRSAGCPGYPIDAWGWNNVWSAGRTAAGSPVNSTGFHTRSASRLRSIAPRYSGAPRGLSRACSGRSDGRAAAGDTTGDGRRGPAGAHDRRPSAGLRSNLRREPPPAHAGGMGHVDVPVLRALDSLRRQPGGNSPDGTAGAGSMGVNELTLDRVGPDPFDPSGLGSIVTVRWPVRIGTVAASVRLWLPESIVGLWLAAPVARAPRDIVEAHRARRAQAGDRGISPRSAR